MIDSNIKRKSRNVVIRKKLKKELINSIKKHFVLLYGKTGSGKTYLAKNLGDFINTKRQLAKKIDIFYYECIRNNTRENEEQINDYENFLTTTLLNKTNIDHKNEIMTADFSIDDKEHLLREVLENQKNIFFIFDDFDNLKIDDRARLFNFLERNINFSKHSVIFTSNRALNYYSNVPEEIKEKAIGTIDREEFHKICKQYIKKTLDRRIKHSINQIRLKIGRKEFYNFIYEKSEGDLCLMNEILIDLKRKLLDKNVAKKGKKIRDLFESMKKNYSINRGKVLKILLQDLDIDNKKILQLLSFFEKPVNYADLFKKDKILKCSKCNTAITIKRFNEVIEECNNIFFGGYIKKENDKYYIEKTLKDLLDKERNNMIYEDVYKDLIETWILYYKEFTKEHEKRLDEYLNGTLTDENNNGSKETILKKIDDEFDNITKVLNYCFEKQRWQDYYTISDHIWYYCELKNKDVNEYHYKRYFVARELNDNEKIFESGLHYCNIACKKGIHTAYRVQKTFKDLRELVEIKNVISSERLKVKYKYTLALQYYANKDFKNANNKFAECEKELSDFIKKETNKAEQIKKDYISSVKWHAICLFDNAKLRLDEMKKEKNIVLFDSFEDTERIKMINNKIKDLGNDIYNFIDTMDIALNNYEEIDYNRVRSSILMYKINILIFLYNEVFVKDEDIDWRKLNRKKIKESFKKLEVYKENVIDKDVGLTKMFEKIKRAEKPF